MANVVELRYASQSKETGWLMRESYVSRGVMRRSEKTAKRLFFKLRGATLSAHPAETYPEHWKASVTSVLNADAGSLSLEVKLENATVTLRADTNEDFSRWLSALSDSAGSSFSKYYERKKYLAKGHFSSVYLAVDKKTGEKFAVKIIKKDKNDLAKSKKFVRREVKVLSVTKHDNLLKAVDFFSVNGKPHLVLEYVSGGSLKERIKGEGRLSEGDARFILRGILEGVAYLHDKGIVHRDLKPDNVLMAGKHHPKIADFGLATFLSEENKHVHSVVGTPSYVAPEVMKGVPYGTPADCWAIGVILYQMIVGERPYVGETREDIKKAVLQGAIKFPKDTLDKDKKTQLRHLIASFLTHDPRGRISAKDALSHPWVTGKTGGANVA